MKSLRSLACIALIGACAALAACGTGAADPPGSTVSAAAASHFKADLAIGYTSLEAIDVGAANALQAHAITPAQAKAVQTQRAAFKAALDSLRTAGESPGGQTTLTATLAAINAAAVFVTISQGVSK